MKTYKPKKLIVPEHLIKFDDMTILKVKRNELQLYVDEETAYQYVKVIYKLLRRKHRARKIEGEITE